MAYSRNSPLKSVAVLSEPSTNDENITPAVATKRRASSTSRKNSSQFAQVFHPSLSSMNKNKKKVPKSGKNKISKPDQNVTLSAISAMFQPRPFFIPGTPAGLITAGVPFSGHKAKAFAATSTTTAFDIHAQCPAVPSPMVSINLGGTPPAQDACCQNVSNIQKKTSRRLFVKEKDKERAKWLAQTIKQKKQEMSLKMTSPAAKKLIRKAHAKKELMKSSNRIQFEKENGIDTNIPSPINIYRRVKPIDNYKIKRIAAEKRRKELAAASQKVLQRRENERRRSLERQEEERLAIKQQEAEQLQVTMQHNAAITIASTFKKYMLYKNKAAVQITSSIRHYVFRQSVSKSILKIKASITIQSCLRKSNAYKTLLSLRVIHFRKAIAVRKWKTSTTNLRHYNNTRKAAVTLIQAVWRGNYEINEYRAKQHSVLKIQCK